MHLPAEIVWFHVVLAALTWLSLLWSVAATGRIAAREASVREPEPELAAQELVRS
jgi:cytochrome c oxidase assembly protein subunit 15